jgi:hypothetical protein
MTLPTANLFFKVIPPSSYFRFRLQKLLRQFLSKACLTSLVDRDSRSEISYHLPHRTHFTRCIHSFVLFSSSLLVEDTCASILIWHMESIATQPRWSKTTVADFNRRPRSQTDVPFPLSMINNRMANTPHPMPVETGCSLAQNDSSCQASREPPPSRFAHPFLSQKIEQGISWHRFLGLACSLHPLLIGRSS